MEKCEKGEEEHTISMFLLLSTVQYFMFECDFQVEREYLTCAHYFSRLLYNTDCNISMCIILVQCTTIWIINFNPTNNCIFICWRSLIVTNQFGIPYSHYITEQLDKT